MRTFSKIFLNTLLVLLVLMVVLFAAPRLVGIRMFSVLSGSMEPAYSTGDLIYVAPVDAEKLQVGDVISFVMNSQGTVATHRVIEIDQQNRQLYTKGDANQVSDGKAVQFENVIGKVVFGIPLVGYLIGFINTPPGKIITVTIVVSLILLVLLLQRLSTEEEEEQLQEEKLRVAPARLKPAAIRVEPEPARRAPDNGPGENTPEKGNGKESPIRIGGYYSRACRYQPRYSQQWGALNEMERGEWPLCRDTTENTDTHGKPQIHIA